MSGPIQIDGVTINKAFGIAYGASSGSHIGIGLPDRVALILYPTKDVVLQEGGSDVVTIVTLIKSALHLGRLLDLGALRALKVESGKKIFHKHSTTIPSFSAFLDARNGFYG